MFFTQRRSFTIKLACTPPGRCLARRTGDAKENSAEGRLVPPGGGRMALEGCGKALVTDVMALEGDVMVLGRKEIRLAWNSSNGCMRTHAAILMKY